VLPRYSRSGVRLVTPGCPVRPRTIARDPRPNSPARAARALSGDVHLAPFVPAGLEFGGGALVRGPVRVGVVARPGPEVPGADGPADQVIDRPPPLAAEVAALPQEGLEEPPRLRQGHDSVHSPQRVV